MIGECSYCYIARGFGAKKCPYCGRILRRAAPRGFREGERGEKVDTRMVPLSRVWSRYAGRAKARKEALSPVQPSHAEAPQEVEREGTCARNALMP